MAQVWAARLRGTRGFQKIVAVKTILAGALDDARMEAMLLEEATLASQIHHPNVVGTVELGEQDGVLFLVMEWVEGESLGYILSRAGQRGGLPMKVAINLIGQACKGLHAAHELQDENGSLVGLVHRDLSTHNVLVTYSGTAKLVDFGIAKATARASSLTEAGMVKGKFAYMSPEQVSSQPIDRRSDIFGMGVLLYLLTTGRHPFKGESVAETVRNVCLDQPPMAPSRIVEGYPLELEEVVLKALHKSPDKRFATAHDLLAALEKVMPEALEGSFEAEVGRYLNDLVGNRAAERRTQLRLAQQLADKLRGDGSGTMVAGGDPGSLGSLRTVSVGEGTGSSIRLANELRAQALNADPLSTTAPQPVKTGRSSWFGIAIGVGGLVVALGLVAFDRVIFQAHNASEAPLLLPPLSSLPPTASAVPVPPPVETNGELKMGPLEVRAPAASASAAVQSAPPSTREASKPSRKSTSNTSRTGSTPSANAASAAPAASEPAHPEKQEGKINAWDTDTFGGRR